MQLYDITTLLHTSERQFEVLKIVLDKGALAVLIALLGAIISLLIERYKSALTRQVELSKIATPMITAMLDANEELFAANCAFIRDCAAEFAEFETWVRSMLSTRLAIDKALRVDDIPHGENCRSTSVSCEGHSLTLDDFLVFCSPSQRITDLIRTPAFWSSEVVTGTSGSLVRNLYLAHRSRSPEELFADMYYAVAKVYAGSRGAHHTANLHAQNKFRLLAMKNLYPTNRAQRKAMDSILKVQSVAHTSLLTFPRCDVGRAVGLMPEETPTTYDLVLKCHAALINQLKLFLRGQA